MGSVRALKFWSVVVILVMLGLIVRASMVENVIAAGVRLGKDPWGLATLADCGFGFAAIGMWVGYRERSVPKGAAWTAVFMVLGNVAIGAYLLWATLRLRPGAGMRELVNGSAA